MNLSRKLVASLLLALPLVFTGCGGDEDDLPGNSEIENGSGNGDTPGNSSINFTVNGKVFTSFPTSESIFWRVDKNTSGFYPVRITAQAHVQDPETYDDWVFTIDLLDSTVYNGALIFDAGQPDAIGLLSKAVVNYEDINFSQIGAVNNRKGDNLGGKITISNLTATTLTLKFDNYRFKTYRYNSEETVLNGTITFPRSTNDNTEVSLTGLNAFATELNVNGFPASGPMKSLRGTVNVSVSNANELELWLSYSYNAADGYSGGNEMTLYCDAQEFKAGRKLNVRVPDPYYGDDSTPTTSGTVEVVSISKNQALIKFTKFKISGDYAQNDVLDGTVRYISPKDL